MSENKINPFLWFDNQAEEATKLYTSIFPDSELTHIQRQGEAAFIVSFSIGGQPLSAMNAGPMFTFNPSISFYTVCETEEELDNAWEKLLEGGMAMMPLDKYAWSEKYGWLKDRYGLSWQLTLGKISDVGQKISPLLMFTEKQHGKAEEAINLYTSIFKNSGVNLMARYEKGDDDPAVGTVKHAQFRIENQLFMAMDSSYTHGFEFNEAISFVVNCGSQEEVDYFWEKLTADGGEESMCGWLKDKFGVSWQIVPEALHQLIGDPDPGRAQRATGAMMQMHKIDIAKLQQAADDDSKTILTVQTTVHAPIEKVWKYWSQPEHITQWNNASDDWHSPSSENDLRIGGKFKTRMEAKDGSVGFDFGGTYTAVVENKLIEYFMDDGRTVQVTFSEVDNGTFVMENFEAEKTHSLEMQQGGWQAILDNFKKYVEEN